MSLDANLDMWKHIAEAALERSKMKGRSAEYKKKSKTLSTCASEIIKNIEIIQALFFECDCNECRPTMH